MASTVRNPSKSNTTVGMAIERAAARNCALPPPKERRAVRIAARLHQREVALLLGVDRVTVTRWENGHREPAGELRTRYACLLEQLRHG